MSSPQIHPSAVVDASAQLGPGCRVGPHAVIEAGVVLGPECVVGPGVVILGPTHAGARNRFHAGAVIGDDPQDFKYDGGPTRLRIGDDNIIREHATIHRSAKPDGETVVGDGNFLMAGCHVGHDCVIGNKTIIAGGALLAGHARIGDRAFISGNCLVHQLCRVGRLALMQGGSAISKDLPPFCVARGGNGLAGFNVIGLRRAGITAGERLELRRAYHRLFRSGQPLRAALASIRAEFAHAPLVLELADFVGESRRGVVRDISRRRAGIEESGGEED